jgi:hypothetical protein
VLGEDTGALPAARKNLIPLNTTSALQGVIAGV